MKNLKTAGLEDWAYVDSSQIVKPKHIIILLDTFCYLKRQAPSTKNAICLLFVPHNL